MLFFLVVLTSAVFTYFFIQYLSRCVDEFFRFR